MEAGQTPPAAPPTAATPPPAAPPPPSSGGSGGRGAGGIALAILFGLVALALAGLAIALAGVTLCEDQFESGCSTDSSGTRTLKVIFGGVGALAAVAAVVSALRWRKGGPSGPMLGAIVATVVLTALLFVL